MHEQIKAFRCTCWCGHKWVAEKLPKRCAAAKCKSRRWDQESNPIREHTTERKPLKEPEPLKTVKPADVPPVPKSRGEVTICPECYAMNGQHQKFCSRRM